MLDTDTKRRIDTARNLLVGKVPDPKSQVEQITIALIYKFMDDMDAEAEELGGKRKFFSGEYGKFGWAKLMQPGIGGHELLSLYADGISKMPENPGIPALFRDIFKNAYLPYRDPETLKSFLKVINEFSYDHSERLGDAFEYLLSVLGSQGDAGQFRTPRHIIDFIVEILAPRKEEVLLDPSCGTAGFLISAYKHILRSNTDAKGHSTLTPQQRGEMAKNFKGYDISPDMVRLSLVNLYLHGFTDPHIFEYDTLTDTARWNEFADVILANPPFMSPKGGIRPHNRFSIQAKRSEVLFVDYIAEHLTPNGRAGIIVPEGIIFQSQNAYKDLRKMLVENSLVSVISLPAGCFNPYSGVKTSILLLDKSLARQSDTIAFFKVEADGYDLGAQRRPIQKNDLPKVQEELETYLTTFRERKDPSDLALSAALIVPKEKIAANGDYNLSGERYREGNETLSEFPHIALGEICEINPETAIPQELYPASHFNYIDISCVENESGNFLGPNRTASDDAPSRARRSVKAGDVLLSTVRPNLKAFTLLSEVPERAIASTGFAVLRAQADRVLPGYLINVLRDDRSVNQMIGMAGKGAYPSINQKDVEAIQIPLPPLEVQKEIVAEIDGYQKVIDGARAVLDNYRPHIPINPAWPIKELGEIAEIQMGQSPPGETYNTEGKGVPLINGPVEFGPEAFSLTVVNQYTTAPTKMCKRGDLILCVRGSTTGRMNIAGYDGCIGRGVASIRAHESQEWVNYAVNSLRDRIYDLGVGSTFPNINSKEIASLPIPLPSHAEQQAIVAEIEAEQNLVNANRELMTRFEAKIQTTLSRIWGDESSIS
jgi:type I restriction enzyme M protein